uniref:C2H2-type domain-containing protein n=1 Tax=Globisporangium ultimum (strain ATCC 200006 / CBS 805.95 / DAOM BR144) TaxID=431595 RepID=K3XA82_GLOUD
MTADGKKAQPNVLAQLPAFYIDEGYFTPYRMVVCGNEKVAAKIASLLGDWARWSGEGGSVTTSQEAFKPTVRILDVAYTPQDADRDLSTQQTWTYREPFIVEIAKISGQGSQRSALDRKIRNEYFQHGAQLGWLIDPRPDCHKMYEYKLDDDGQVYCVNCDTWRDLDCGTVLPGFTLAKTDLDMVLRQIAGSLSDEEVDYVCPRCQKRLQSLNAWAGHGEWHRAERARQKHKEKQ